MNESMIVQHENAFYSAFKGESRTEAQLRKTTKLSDEEVAELLQYFRDRLYVEENTEGKEPTYTLTPLAERDMQATYG